MSQEKTKDMSQYFYRASAADFMKIPGMLIGYWSSKQIISAFLEAPKLGSMVVFRKGMVTADNDEFIRNWHETSFERIGLNYADRVSAMSSGKKWFPYTKGGEYRKWFGNNNFVVNWEDDGFILQNKRHHTDDRVAATNFNLDFIFKEGATYSSISSSLFSIRYTPAGFLYDQKGAPMFSSKVENLRYAILLLNSNLSKKLLSILCPTLDFNSGSLTEAPAIRPNNRIAEEHDEVFSKLIDIAQEDWNAYEASWNFSSLPLLYPDCRQPLLKISYQKLRAHWCESTLEMKRLEEQNNRIFIDAYGLHDELTPDVPLEEVTLTCNPHYRYGGNRSEEELETLLQCDTLKELVSYAIGCMMGRYSIDKPGLILASQGEALQDYLNQIQSPRFMPDDDAILPLTDQEWFADDATNRFREFVRVVWGDEHLQENLDFIAESLCLHAIKAKRGESALDTVRRYLSTQFYKDHMRTYKKRPIYWLFSSGKQKAFECLVYLHRYNEGTLARMRTEYVIPLTAKLTAYADKLEQDKAASASAAETKRLEKEINTLHKQQAELAEFDEKLRHYADQRIALDLDDGVKVNYGKFGDLLAEVKAITGEKAK